MHYLKKVTQQLYIALILWCVMLSHSTAQSIYTIAIVPQFPALEIHRNWTPILKIFEQQTGERFELKILESIPAFEREFARGGPDFVYLNPYHMVMAYKQQKYLPLVRDNKEQLSGILVVKHDSPIQSVQQLDGLPISFPAPNAFGASLYMRALLAEKFKINIKPQYVKTHSNAYRYVASGQSAAAGGIRSTFEKEPAELRQQLRVLYETPQTPPHPFAVHPRVPEKIKTALQNALLNLKQTDAGLALLKGIQMPEPVAADYKRDYQALDALGLEKYIVVEDNK